MPRPLRLILLAVAILTGACGATSESPVRNPLAEGIAPAPPSIPPVVTAAAMPRDDSVPPPEQLEPAAGRASALLAEWLAIPERELTVMVAEAVAWPSACLGVEYPGTVCASVITPGFRVLLRDRLGGLHAVHLNAASGDARWAGEARAQGTVTNVDRTGQRATISIGGRALEVRLVAGSRWLPDLARASATAAPVTIAYDPSGSSSVPPIAAWIALDPA